MNSRLKLTYWVPGFNSRKLKMIPKNKTVGEVLDIIKTAEKRPELDSVVVENMFLCLSDQFDDVYEPGCVYTFMTEDRNRPIPQPPQGRGMLPAGSERVFSSNADSDKWDIYLYTTLDYESIVKPHIFYANRRMEYNEVREAVVKVIRETGKSRGDFAVALYVTGGAPFVSGRLEEQFQTEQERVLYCVIYRGCPEDALRKQFTQFYNIEDDSFQRLLSPVEAVDPIGLCQIALILCYLQFDGARARVFMRSAIYVTFFAPLAVALWRLVNEKALTGSDIVVITSCLHAVFATFLETRADDGVFKYALKCASFLASAEVPRFTIRIESGTWISNGQRIELPRIKSFRDLENAFIREPGFRPWNLDEVQLVSGSAFVKVPPLVGLKVVGRVGKDRTLSNTLDLINPLARIPRAVLNVRRIAYAIENQPIIELPRVISPKEVSQIVMFCVDSSISMYENDRYFFVDQLITQMMTFYAKQGDVAVGLCYFSDDIQTKHAPFLLSQSEHQLPSHFGGRRKLWDGIAKAVESVCESRYLYTNAFPRIIAISCGEDNDSRKTGGPTAKSLAKTGIMMDSLVLCPNEELCAISHTTGGISVLIQRPEKLLDFCELEVFLNPRVRTPSARGVNARSPVYDQIFWNMEIMRIETDAALVKPTADEDIDESGAVMSRKVRIMKELKLMAAKADANFAVFRFEKDIEKWRIGFRIQPQTPEVVKCGLNRWFELCVEFPEEYPYAPPNIRFMEPVPYHMNITCDGKICLGSLQDEYFAAVHVVDLVTSIMNLLVRPVACFAVSPMRYAMVKWDRLTFDAHVARRCREDRRTKLEEDMYVRK